MSKSSFLIFGFCILLLQYAARGEVESLSRYLTKLTETKEEANSENQNKINELAKKLLQKPEIASSEIISLLNSSFPIARHWGCYLAGKIKHTEFLNDSVKLTRSKTFTIW
jgi:hypothetical protein